MTEFIFWAFVLATGIFISDLLNVAFKYVLGYFAYKAYVKRQQKDFLDAVTRVTKADIINFPTNADGKTTLN